jgi:hypothetical protein
VRLGPEIPAVPDDAAGLRAVNARLRELLAERDASRGLSGGDKRMLGRARLILLQEG